MSSSRGTCLSIGVAQVRSLGLLAGSIDADQAQVTALFLTVTALRQVAFVPSFIAGALWRSKPHPLPLDPHD